MSPIEVIVWVCVVVFALTAVLTMLHVSGLYTLPNPEHGKVLFKALVIEVVVIAVAAFGGRVSNGGNGPSLDECAQPDPPFSCVTGDKNESIDH